MPSNSSARFYPIILAGGSGTRFWPRSRKANPKQILTLCGTTTMIQQTVERLLHLADAEDIWVITNPSLRSAITEQLSFLRPDRILSEPAPRNTAPACALAAFLLEKSEPDAVLGIFPSDHVVGNPERFGEIIAAGVALASRDNHMVVLGVRPTHAETGYGYIERGPVAEEASSTAGLTACSVRRFTEKPNRELAEMFVANPAYAWNSGIFLWKVRTLTEAIRRFSPQMAGPLERIADAWGTPAFDAVFATEYVRCANISIDFAVLEPQSRLQQEEGAIYCLPADFLWNDLGSWSALHEHKINSDSYPPTDRNVLDQADPQSQTEDASGNYIYAPGKVVSLIGVHDLVVVETDDALLVTTRERSQDVAHTVSALRNAGREDVL